MLRPFVHYGIHFIVPIVIAYFFFRSNFKSAVIILLLGICIDIDHLWATPIFDANRCSIGFHFLHQYYAIAIYILLLVFKRTRIFGIALLIHILADITDCYLMSN
ncbi:DUF6122 family protein [Joostella sp. CR20]|uniref:DUF6122 family protein n=1 Tax=Joostella sp. CR20 TaxID=2804312 RepID=UPI00313C1DF1